MKKFHILLIILAELPIIACEDKHDINGLLDGNWQLTEWRDTQADTLVADNNSLIFYTVKLQLMQFKKAGGDTYFSHFKHTGDSLILNDSYLNLANSDSIVHFTAMQYLGVPNNGRFGIMLLTQTQLKLTTPTHSLTFRRY